MCYVNKGFRKITIIAIQHRSPGRDAYQGLREYEAPVLAAMIANSLLVPTIIIIRPSSSMLVVEVVAVVVVKVVR